MRLLRKVVVGVLVLVLVFVLLLVGGAYVVFVGSTFPQTNGTLPVTGLQSRVEVYRDKWGVPHLYAENEHDLFFAQGYVHAQDRLWQMEFNRRIGTGTLSASLGCCLR